MLFALALLILIPTSFYIWCRIDLALACGCDGPALVEAGGWAAFYLALVAITFVTWAAT